MNKEFEVVCPNCCALFPLKDLDIYTRFCDDGDGRIDDCGTTFTCPKCKWEQEKY